MIIYIDIGIGIGYYIFITCKKPYLKGSGQTSSPYDPGLATFDWQQLPES